LLSASAVFSEASHKKKEEEDGGGVVLEEGIIDFEEGLTITKSPDIYVKLTILQRRYELLNLFNQWQVRIDDLRLRERLVASLKTLFLEVEPSIKRRYEALKKKKDNEEAKMYEELFTWVKEGFKSDNELVRAISTLNSFFDTIRLTRIDTRKEYDRTNVEAENYEKGL